MKKTLLTLTSALAVSAAFSQGHVTLTKAQREATLPVLPIVEQMGVAGNASYTPKPGHTSVNRTVSETQIGVTVYDLQTNSSIARRLIHNSNGSNIATWTFTPGGQTTATTRGTGYNYFNGSTWGALPTATIEPSNERTGWPNPVRTGFGKEHIVAHSTANNILHQMSRTTAGTGSWTQSNMTFQDGQLWSRTAVGGANQNTIHMIGMTTPVANDGSVYSCTCPSNGMDGAFLYSRSTNGGTSFDIVDYTIPGTGYQYFNDFDGDSYAIDAKGDTVAIVVGGLGRGVQLFKSTNNGVSWTKTDVFVSDTWWNNGDITDTTGGYSLWTSDGSVNVLIDNGGTCHVWYGALPVFTLDGAAFSFYPFAATIEYWNETFPVSEAVTLIDINFLDFNGNSQIDMDINTLANYRFSGIVSFPQAGIDANGCMYLSYVAAREDLMGSTQNYRHVFVTKSCDGGCSWSYPIDVTESSSNAYIEASFPSIARLVDSKIHIIYQADNEPGMSSVPNGTGHAPSDAEIRYLSEDATRFDTVEFCPTVIVGDTFLCLGGSTQLTALSGNSSSCNTTYSWTGPNSFTSTSQSVAATAFGTYTCTITTPCGAQVESVNVVAYNGTGGPIVTISASAQEICTGGSETLTANASIGGVSYLWSTSASTATINITQPGTYTVTVQDCNGGSTVESITVAEPNVAPKAIIGGDLSLCTGQNTTLTVSPSPSASYLWSNGLTTQSISVNAAGTYTVTVTNCKGNATASATVTIAAVPDAEIVGDDFEGCEGEMLTVSVNENSGGTSFIWSNGSTDPTLSISQSSESGTYTVTVSNACGDSDVASVTLTIHPTPAGSTISFDGTNYVSSASGTHAWYINGTLVAGQTANTFPGSAVGYGQKIQCTFIDANGCYSLLSNELVGINNVGGFQASVLVYPNPNNGQFDIRFGAIDGSVNLSLVNTLGQVVYTTNVTAQPYQTQAVNIKAEAGVYQLRVESAVGSAVLPLVIK